jgi:hypothetical protein
MELASSITPPRKQQSVATEQRIPARDLVLEATLTLLWVHAGSSCCPMPAVRVASMQSRNG